MVHTHHTYQDMYEHYNASDKVALANHRNVSRVEVWPHRYIVSTTMIGQGMTVFNLLPRLFTAAI